MYFWYPPRGMERRVVIDAGIRGSSTIDLSFNHGNATFCYSNGSIFDPILEGLDVAPRRKIKLPRARASGDAGLPSSKRRLIFSLCRFHTAT